LRRQTWKNFEWIVLAHGPLPASLEADLQRLRAERNVRIFLLAENLGIIGAMRYCLERARNDYILPLDADDLLTADALQVFAYYIQLRDRPSLLYSDEDTLRDGVPDTPFLRPDWDEVLAFSTSYVWHACAIRRDRAITSGLYQDQRANWCHDWDSVLRVAASGESIVHIPEILYHWRAHPSSSTNRADPESGSLQSQHFVLDRERQRISDAALFEVQEFPIYRGATEYWLRRLRSHPPSVDVLIFGENEGRMVASAGALLRNSGFRFGSIYFAGTDLSSGNHRRVADLIGGDYPENRIRCGRDSGPQQLTSILDESTAEYMVVCSDRVRIEGDEWPWECDGLFRLHRNLCIVSGRVLAPDRSILAGVEILGFDGIAGCPDAGRDRDHPGYFALALKPRSISAPYSELFVARSSFLRASADDLPKQATWQGLGCWLGALAGRRGQGVAVTPLFTGTLVSDPFRIHMDKEEAYCYIDRFSSLLPDTRWYSPLFGWRKSAGYRLEPPALTPS
jgi:hypothetical protein